MKLFSLATGLLALSWALAGCASDGPPPTPPVPHVANYSGLRVAVVVDERVGRKKHVKATFPSEAVRNYLRDALEESIASQPVFTVIGVAPGISETTNFPHVSAAIVSVRRITITGMLGPLFSSQAAVIDATMEVRLVQRGREDIVYVAETNATETAEAVVVAAKQYKDWGFDDSWASVACTEALQMACGQLAAKVESEQRMPVANNTIQHPILPVSGQPGVFYPSWVELLADNPPDWQAGGEK